MCLWGVGGGGGGGEGGGGVKPQNAATFALLFY